MDNPKNELGLRDVSAAGTEKKGCGCGGHGHGGCGCGHGHGHGHGRRHGHGCGCGRHADDQAEKQA